MKDLYKRFLSTIILIGSSLIILQLVFAFVSIFFGLDRMISSTASSLLSSTNHEVTENVDNALNRMIKIGNQIAGDEEFRSYSRSENSLSKSEQIGIELGLGRKLSSYTTLDEFCDCGVIYKDGTSLGQIDAATVEHFPGKELYTSFSPLSDRDNENFFVGNKGDYSRLYYAKALNSSAIVLVSILRESLEPIFYDAEENYNLTLRLTTNDHHIIYSGDKEENIDGVLDTNLSQTIENNNHISTELNDLIIASDTCTNGWRVTCTIPEDTLTAENTGLRALYLVVSIGLSALSIVLMLLLCRHVKRRTEEFAQIEESLDQITGLDDINLN